MEKRKGILTSKDVLGEKNKDAGEKSPAPVKTPVDAKTIFKYKFPPAPLGKSQTTITFNNKTLVIEMMDGVYTFPEMDRKDSKELEKLLAKLGFENVSTVGKKLVVEKVKEKKPEWIYKIGHPENTDEVKISGVVAVEIEGSSKQFECVEGVVTTESKQEYLAFREKGWYEVSITQKEKQDENIS